MLNIEQRDSLRQILATANRLINIGESLKAVVDKCSVNETVKGLDEMVAMAFNAAQHQPQYGGSGGLPPGKYKGVIVDSRQENVEKNGQIVGGYLALDLTPIEGPLVGTKQTDRLNLHNTSGQVVEIANKQLSAYCHVLNVFQFQDTAQLHNIPFFFEIGWQKGHEPSEAKPNGGYTEVKSIADVNGNAPGKAGAGPQAQQQQAQPMNIPPAQVAPTGQPAQGQGWGAQGGSQPAQGQPAQGIDSGVAMPAQATGQPAQGWGAAGAGQPAQAAQGWTPGAAGAAGGGQPPASWGAR